MMPDEDKNRPEVKAAPTGEASAEPREESLSERADPSEASAAPQGEETAVAMAEEPGEKAPPDKKKRGPRPTGPRRRPKGEARPRPGPMGIVTAIEGDVVHLDLGTSGRGVIGLDQFEKAPEVGEKHQFSLVSIDEGVWRVSRREEQTDEAWSKIVVGREVDGVVVGTNSGGLELDIGLVSAFLPSSEIAFHRVTDLAPFVGQSLCCEVLEVVRKRHRVVVSRKAVLARQKQKVRDERLATLSVGQVLEGKVARLEPFGAFVDIGGINGLVHVTNMAHHRVTDPKTILRKGQKIEVKILEIQEEGRRIGLGIKQLQPDPWEEAAARFPAGTFLRAKVVRLAEFGAFVEILPGIDGLLHKSRLSPDRVDNVQDAVSVGEEISVAVQSVDAGSRRISLTRVNARGDLIDSAEDVVVEAEPEREAPAEDMGPAGTNLGALLRAALEKRGGKDA
jgi:ribosomal protein S1